MRSSGKERTRGRAAERFPVNSNEAEGRRTSRFFAMGHTPGPILPAPEMRSPERPFTLDLPSSRTWLCQPQRAKSRCIAASEKPEGLYPNGPLVFRTVTWFVFVSWASQSLFQKPAVLDHPTAHALAPQAKAGGL